ncbi:MAG: NAD(P)-binding protein [Actinomycetales bacterium]|nr:NAD(P)-binding protein [Leifsonia sp.]
MTVMQLETDYLIVGAGAMGLNIADTLISETDFDVTIVDRRGMPGGHWNDAYSFVTLHQPSSHYGVNSMALGSGLKDTVGLNKGLYELASGAEVSSYFDSVMNQRLLPSGRVSYRPLCNYLGNGRFQSLLSGVQTEVMVRRKTIDATLYSPSIPATHEPGYEVDERVRLVPPNALPGLWERLQNERPPRRFVVVGAGKTGMDVCIWLVQSGADPGSIDWVVPRDSWMINRATTQNAPEFFDQAIGSQADQMEAAARATSVDDLFLRLEWCGAMLRTSVDHMPRMFHFATLSTDELKVLRLVGNVIRLGRVQALHVDRMVLDQGTVPVLADTLFIDCSASAVDYAPPEPIFQGDRIVPQMVRAPFVAFSAAMIAYVEAHYVDDAEKNILCAPVPFPRSSGDYPKTILVNMANQFHWGKDKALSEWMRASRLDAFGKLTRDVEKDDAGKQAVLARLRGSIKEAVVNLPNLVLDAAN